MICNVTKRWAEQEIWREAATNDAAQARIAQQIGVERLKRAFGVALRRISSPIPGTEAAAKAARAALHLP